MTNHRIKAYVIVKYIELCKSIQRRNIANNSLNALKRTLHNGSYATVEVNCGR